MASDCCDWRRRWPPGAALRGARLYTNQRFKTSVALYASLGYRVEREKPRNGGVTMHMTKPRA